MRIPSPPAAVNRPPALGYLDDHGQQMRYFRRLAALRTMGQRHRGVLSSGPPVRGELGSQQVTRVNARDGRSRTTPVSPPQLYLPGPRRGALQLCHLVCRLDQRASLPPWTRDTTASLARSHWLCPNRLLAAAPALLGSDRRRPQTQTPDGRLRYRDQPAGLVDSADRADLLRSPFTGRDHDHVLSRTGHFYVDGWRVCPRLVRPDRPNDPSEFTRPLAGLNDPLRRIIGEHRRLFGPAHHWQSKAALSG